MDDAATVRTDDIDDLYFEQMNALAREAGHLAMTYFRMGARLAGRIEWKAGNSPVTEADFAVDRLLREGLTALFPQAAWLSEETADTPDRLAKHSVLVVDPIDGTRGFMEGDPRFAISVAMVAGGRPIAAIVHAPAIEQTFAARAGRGAFLNGERITLTARPDLTGTRLAGPKFLTEPVGRRLDMVVQPKVPSLALRFAQVASGAFDVAVASSDAHDWDIAAADLILTEAGARLRGIDGEAPVYNRKETKHGILIAASERFQRPVRDALGEVTAKWRKDNARS